MHRFINNSFFTRAQSSSTFTVPISRWRLGGCGCQRSSWRDHHVTCCSFPLREGPAIRSAGTSLVAVKWLTRSRTGQGPFFFPRRAPSDLRWTQRSRCVLTTRDVPDVPALPRLPVCALSARPPLSQILLASISTTRIAEPLTAALITTNTST